MSGPEPRPLLAGVRVVDLAGEPAAMTGRILADLGADVVKAEPRAGDPLRAAEPNRFRAWNAGKRGVVVDGPDDAGLGALLAAADVVIDTPGFPGSLALDPGRAPDAVWVSVTPFGLEGPRAHWRASDLGVMASSGNMYCTGDADRPPVRCTQPSGYAHVGPEAAFAALTALASGIPQRVDVSMQEVVFTANMATPAGFPWTGFRGVRRGANIGRTREIWSCADGFVSFGLRGGKARVASLETIGRLVLEDGIDAPAYVDRDWSEFSHTTATDEELKALEEPLGEYFARHTMAELYEIACETNLMLAPANSPREIYASAQLSARDFFGPVGDIARFPRSFVVVRSADGHAAPARPSGPAPELGSTRQSDVGSVFEPMARKTTQRGEGADSGSGRLAWEGTKILEFGSGAAGPIATRYFVEHGATVLRIESKSRPDFLRVYALGPANPHGLEGSTLFDGLNVGKLDASFNLKHPAAVDLVKRLVVEWADAVAENYAPRAMRGFGLDYDALAKLKPDLVMISACLNGQTGPHRDYPGFGGQGSALSGFNWLTGWPDREPVGPHATITDSLAPRFVATALAAGLLYRRATGRGVYLDLSQVEAAIFTLSPWLLDFELDGVVGMRAGNSSARALLHGAYPCTGTDCWITIACWTSNELEALARVMNAPSGDLDDDTVAAWTQDQDRDELAERLQAAGVEAVPVEDFGDVHDDPQVAAREHFVPLTHPVRGDWLYERNGFRLSAAPSGYRRAGPTLGQDDDYVLGDLLGLTPEEREKLAADGAFD